MQKDYSKQYANAAPSIGQAGAFGKGLGEAPSFAPPRAAQSRGSENVNSNVPGFAQQQRRQKKNGYDDLAFGFDHGFQSLDYRGDGGAPAQRAQTEVKRAQPEPENSKMEQDFAELDKFFAP